MGFIEDVSEEIWKSKIQEDALQEQRADLVDHRRAMAHRARAYPMQSLKIELLDRLRRHEAHPRI